MPTSPPNAAASSSSSAPNPLASPNAIPPRTSSTHGHGHSNSVSSISQPNPPPRSTLRPLSEADWLGQKQSAWQTPSTSSAMDPAQQRGGYQQAAQPPNPQRYAHEDFNFTTNKAWSADKERLVRGPFEYSSSHPGKDFRAQMIGSFNAWLDVPAESLAIVTKAVGMLHESSLLVDDVQDSSELRRGFPVAHSIFGVPQTINSANYMYFVALQELQKLKNHKAVSTFAEELVHLHRGQGMDLFWRDTLTCPTEDEYLEMVGNKTGGLFRLGIKLMQAESSSSMDCVPLVNLIGLIFQIRDDYMNLASKEYTHNKGMCEDLTEGKFSFPVIHSIRADPTNLQLINILKQKPTDMQVKRYAVAYMESTGSFEYTRKVVAVLIERARSVAEELDGGMGKTAGIQKILDKMVIE